MKVLITAGPTREPIDEVRYITNSSSGRTGFSIAMAAVKNEHSVTLIAGPTLQIAPQGCRYIPVNTAKEMCDATKKWFSWCDALVMSAAVVDYSPAKAIKGKMKKDAGSMTLKLKRNVDILSAVTKQKESKMVVGFALESAGASPKELLSYAREKLMRKKLDFIVANNSNTLGGDRITGVVLEHPSRGGKVYPFHNMHKFHFGNMVVSLLEYGHL